MKISTPVLKFSALTLAVVCAFSAQAARADFNLANYRYKIEPSSAFSTARSIEIDRVNSHMATSGRFRAQADGQTEPFITRGPASMISDLDAPNGEIWSYVSYCDYEEIPPHDEIQYTDRILREYTFEIYDADYKLVGTVKDKMEYAEDEIRSVLNDLAPVVTRNFFNDDDKFEIILSLGINTTKQENRYKSLIYQINGEKDAEGYDKPIMEYSSLVVDVIDGPSTDGKDNYYISFGDEYYPSDDEMEPDSGFWDYLCKAKVRIDTYGPARGADAPRRLMHWSIPILQLPGDQQSTPYMMSFTRGNEVYFVLSSLEEPFYNRYDNPITEDVTQRESNNLIVSFYKTDANGDIKFDYDTRIPFKKDNVDGVIASYYSIGNLRYRRDIDFDNFGTPSGRAALYVTKENYVSASDSFVKSYYVYDNSGKLIRTLAEGCDSAIPMSDISGHEPQVLFVTADVYAYYFDFTDLISGKVATSFSNLFEVSDDSDPESLTANFDRVAAGDSYMYVNEMRMPGIDEDENDIMRFIWIKKDGTFDHIDQVNMGPHVLYAKSYIESAALDPKAYHSDDNYEYMILVKRGTGEAGNTSSVEELIIGQEINEANPKGKTLLHVTPDERGVLSGIVPNFSPENPERAMLSVAYYDAEARTYAQDFYPLPLDREVVGITDAEIKDEISGIHVYGTTVSADGAISVYDTAGALVAAGHDTLGLGHLAAGVYIVRANDSARKIFIK